METKVKIIRNADTEAEAKQLSFMERDILGVMKELKMDKPLIIITSYEGTQKEKKDSIKEILKIIGNMDCVVAAPAYVSVREFSREEYTMDKKAEPNKKKLPIGKTLKRENSMLESLGFININDFVNYEFQTAFLYGNDNGRKVKKYIDQINGKIGELPQIVKI